jgi:glucokinase
MKALAIDLGGTHATCAVIEDQTILASKHLDLNSAHGLTSVLPIFVSTLRELLDSAQLTTTDCAGLAISSCGLVNSREGRVLSSPQKWDDAVGIDFNAWCRAEFSLPLKMENDARMALMGEWYAGVGRGFENVAMITLGTGIGSAVMIEGKLLRGKHSQAGNLCGHLPILFDGRKCTCGGIGCAEAEAGGWSLPSVAKDWPGYGESRLANESTITFEALFRVAAAGDQVARKIQNRCLAIWAATAVGMVHAFDPEMIIFGGGVMKSADLIVPHVQQHVAAHSWTPWGAVQIRSAKLGNDAGLLGAIPLLSA